MERTALYVLSIYAVCITFWHARTPAINALCTRDFVTPAAEGTCLCGEKQFCLCTPSLASDIIIELEDERGAVRDIVFIERKDGRGLAMVGGFVRVGESAEDAAVREALEETGLNVHHLRQWCMFSRPRRDPRRHTAALVFVARAKGIPHAHDDAKAIKTVPIAELQRRVPTFAFDHGDIVGAFMRHFHPVEGEAPRRGNRSVRSGGGGNKGKHRDLAAAEADEEEDLDLYDWACQRPGPAGLPAVVVP